MKICVAQTKPVKGNIEINIEGHKKLIDLAVSNAATIIIFPELSLTGYEPTLAKELATYADDKRFDDFQTISDARQVTIGVGVPLKNSAGTCISMVLFQPHTPRQVYSKNYLHSDEELFFVSCQSPLGFISTQASVTLAICYELSVPEHSEKAFKSGAEIYVASVAKTANGVEKACKSLAGIAKKYSIMVLMSNCVGICDGEECGGKTAAWNKEGMLLAQLDETNEGILIVDTDTEEIVQRTL